MELIQVSDKTYYIKNATNIGVYKINDSEVFLIDSGNDKDAGKKVLKIIEGEGWSVKGIISTHSNADHIGANKVIQDRCNCPIFATGLEKCFCEHPILEPSFLYGGFPFKDLNNKFLLAKESSVVEIKDNLPRGLETFSLKGHFFDMVGIKTDDGVYFLADSLFSEETITKYHIFFIYDVKEYLNTLDALSTLDGKLYIPSHCEATDDISPLIEINRNKIAEISDTIISLCAEKTSFEDLVKKIFDHYSLTLNANQFVLVGSTIRSYLSYLYGEGKITFEFSDNKMFWKQI